MEFHNFRREFSAVEEGVTASVDSPATDGLAKTPPSHQSQDQAVKMNEQL